MKHFIRYYTVIAAVILFAFPLSAASVAITLDNYTTYVRTNVSSHFGKVNTNSLGLNEPKTIISVDFNAGVFANKSMVYSNVFELDSDGTNNMLIDTNGYDGTKGLSLSNALPLSLAGDADDFATWTNNHEIAIDFMLNLRQEVEDTASDSFWLTYVKAGTTEVHRFGFSGASVNDQNFESRFVTVTPQGIAMNTSSNAKPFVVSNWNHAQTWVSLSASKGYCAVDTVIIDDGTFGTSAPNGFDWQGLSVTEFTINSGTSGHYLDAVLDNFRITDHGHSDATTAIYDNAGYMETTNLNAYTNDVKTMSVSLSGYRAAEGVTSNIVYFSINGGTTWGVASNEMWGKYFDPREIGATNGAFTGASNDLRVKLVMGTTNDLETVAFNSLNVNYFNTAGSNGIQGVDLIRLESASSFTTSTFPLGHMVVIENQDAIILEGYSAGVNTNFISVYFFGYDGDAAYSNLVTNVAATNDMLYVPFPSDIVTPSGAYGVYIVDNTTGTEDVLYPVVEVFPELPEMGKLISPVAGVQRGSTLTISHYAFAGLGEKMTVALLSVEGRPVAAPVELAITAGVPANYSHTFDISALPNGAYIIRVQVGTTVEQQLIVIAR